MPIPLASPRGQPGELPVIGSAAPNMPRALSRDALAACSARWIVCTVSNVPTPATNYYQVIQTKGTTYNFVTNGGWLDALLTGIAIGMSMLPEEFPVVLAVFMAMGAWRISQARVLTRRAAGN